MNCLYKCKDLAVTKETYHLIYHTLFNTPFGRITNLVNREIIQPHTGVVYYIYSDLYEFNLVPVVNNGMMLIELKTETDLLEFVVSMIPGEKN